MEKIVLITLFILQSVLLIFMLNIHLTLRKNKKNDRKLFYLKYVLTYSSFCIYSYLAIKYFKSYEFSFNFIANRGKLFGNLRVIVLHFSSKIAGTLVLKVLDSLTCILSIIVLLTSYL